MRLPITGQSVMCCGLELPRTTELTNSIINFQLARDQVVLLETASNRPSPFSKMVGVERGLETGRMKFSIWRKRREKCAA